MAVSGTSATTAQRVPKVAPDSGMEFARQPILNRSHKHHHHLRARKSACPGLRSALES
jgi:hypothetical protein